MDEVTPFLAADGTHVLNYDDAVVFDPTGLPYLATHLDTNPGDYIENNALNHALTLGSPTAAEQYLYNFGLGDLKGYDAIFAPTATGPGDIAPEGSKAFAVGFDTISPTDLNSTFDSLVFGAAGPSVDPGSYDVLNGALSEFLNAFNVEDYSLLNAGSLLPVADLIGTYDFLGAGVATAVSDYLQLGLSDLAGYF